MNGPAKILNLGPRSSGWLAAVGIQSIKDLKKLGSIKVYLQVKQAGFPVSLNLLWALEGALHDRPWFSFSSEEKHQLKQKLNHENI